MQPQALQAFLLQEREHVFSVRRDRGFGGFSIARHFGNGVLAEGNYGVAAEEGDHAVARHGEQREDGQ
jgi:hypothetical protein